MLCIIHFENQYTNLICCNVVMGTEVQQTDVGLKLLFTSCTCKVTIANINKSVVFTYIYYIPLYLFLRAIDYHDVILQLYDFQLGVLSQELHRHIDLWRDGNRNGQTKHDIFSLVRAYLWLVVRNIIKHRYTQSRYTASDNVVPCPSDTKDHTEISN